MICDLQPHLANERVTLRPLQAEDFSPLFEVASDPLIWAQHPAHDRYQPAVFRAFFDRAMASGGAFAIFDTHSGAIIGSTRFYDYDPRQSEIIIGYTFFARSHWGGPYNRAAKTLMLDHAFRFVSTIVLHAGPTNYRSCRAIEKIGGVLDGQVTHMDGTISQRYVVRRGGV